MSPVADCANCAPVVHPYRIHYGEGGACSVPECPCLRFRAAESSAPASCSICGSAPHAGGRCPNTRRR